MNTSNASIPSSIFVAAGAVMLVALAFVMVRSDFGPPSREIISFGGVMAIAVALGLTGASVLRSPADLEPVWRVSRLWGVVLGVALVAERLVSMFAISFFMNDTPSHPGHIPGFDPVFVRIFVGGIAALFMTAGFRAAWRTRQARPGILAAVATGVIGGLIAFSTSFLIALFSGPFNGGMLPVAALFVAPMLSTVPGTAGALLGRGFGGMRRNQVPTSS